MFSRLKRGRKQAYDIWYQYIPAYNGTVSSSSNPSVSDFVHRLRRIAYNLPPSGDNAAVIGSCRDRQDLLNFQLQEGKRDSPWFEMMINADKIVPLIAYYRSMKYR